jgi:UDP-N-acetylbacillosamine transaminase
MSENKRIFLCPPHMGTNEQKYIAEAFEANYITSAGEQLDKFEASIREFTGAKYAIGVSCGTAAIHLALRANNIKDGDEVIASTFTFIGSIAPILYERCIPVFIDSDEDSWNLDPLLLLEELASRAKVGIKMPKALIVTHLYGQMAKIDEIKAICDKYGVILIEDAAESLGASINNRQSGTIGQVGIYSFNGNKIITTSGGGMVVTDDEKIAKQIKFLSTQAREPYVHYEHNAFGYNYRMSNIIAAIGRAQMEVLDNRVKRHREIFDIYRENLKEISGIGFMPEIANSIGNRWLSAIVFDETLPIIPEEMRLTLEEDNIESRPLWKPMHQQPLFKDAKVVKNGVSDRLFSRGLCLPSGSAMSDDDVIMVADIIKQTIKSKI